MQYQALIEFLMWFIAALESLSEVMSQFQCSISFRKSLCISVHYEWDCRVPLWILFLMDTRQHLANEWLIRVSAWLNYGSVVAGRVICLNLIDPLNIHGNLCLDYSLKCCHDTAFMISILSYFLSKVNTLEWGVLAPWYHHLLLFALGDIFEPRFIPTDDPCGKFYTPIHEQCWGNFSSSTHKDNKF